MAWPTIKKPYEIQESNLKAQYKNKFETGRIVSRLKHTRLRKRFVLYFKLNNTDYGLLTSAFNTDAGDTFNWTHPMTNVSYTVGYGEDEIRARIDKIEHRWYVEVALEEQ